MASDQKLGGGSEALSCSTLNFWGLFLLCVNGFFPDKYKFPFHELERTEKSKPIRGLHETAIYKSII